VLKRLGFRVGSSKPKKNKQAKAQTQKLHRTTKARPHMNAAALQKTISCTTRRSLRQLKQKYQTLQLAGSI